MTDEALRHYLKAERALEEALSVDPDCAEEFIGMLRNRAARKIMSQAEHRAWRLQAQAGDSRGYP